MHEVPLIDIVEFDELDRWQVDWDLPENEEEPAGYVGDYYDHTPYGDYGASVQYTGFDKPPGIMAGRDLDWHDDSARRIVIRAMMAHCLGREPDPDAVENFLDEYRARMENGHPFEFTGGEIEHMAW